MGTCRFVKEGDEVEEFTKLCQVQSDKVRHTINDLLPSYVIRSSVDDSHPDIIVE